MTAMPRVSVIMPAYDAARTIRASLASAQRQTLADIEILIVDDGSRDMTAALALAAGHGDPRIRVTRQANAGPMAARNRAIAMARAPYLAPLDADDLWHPTYLAEMVAALEAYPAAGFVYALHHVIDDAGRIVTTPPLPLVAGRGLHRHLLVNFVGCGSAAVFRRKALLAAGGYDSVCRVWGGAEDYLLQLRIAARAPIVCVPRRLVGYRRVAGSLSDDPLRMAGARRAAVRTAMHEAGVPSAPLRRWVDADSDRTAAALLVLHGRWGAALPRLARALALDPIATLADIARRVANRCRAVTAPLLWDPAVPFAAADREMEAAPAFGAPLDVRLRRLATMDLAPFADPAGITFQPAEEDEEEIAGTPPVEPHRRSEQRQ